MSKITIWECARMAVQAEERILELLDKSLREDLAETRSDVDLHKSARPRRGSKSSG